MIQTKPESGDSHTMPHPSVCTNGRPGELATENARLERSLKETANERDYFRRRYLEVLGNTVTPEEMATLDEDIRTGNVVPIEALMAEVAYRGLRDERAT